MMGTNARTGRRDLRNISFMTSADTDPFHDGSGRLLMNRCLTAMARSSGCSANSSEFWLIRFVISDKVAAESRFFGFHSRVFCADVPVGWLPTPCDTCAYTSRMSSGVQGLAT